MADSTFQAGIGEEVRRHKPAQWLRKMPVIAKFSPDNLALLRGIPLLRAANTVEEIRHLMGHLTVTGRTAASPCAH